MQQQEFERYCRDCYDIGFREGMFQAVEESMSIERDRVFVSCCMVKCFVVCLVKWLGQDRGMDMERVQKMADNVDIEDVVRRLDGSGWNVVTSAHGLFRGRGVDNEAVARLRGKDENLDGLLDLV